jgi:hypothetical protein
LQEWQRHGPQSVRGRPDKPQHQTCPSALSALGVLSPGIQTEDLGGAAPKRERLDGDLDLLRAFRWLSHGCPRVCIHPRLTRGDAERGWQSTRPKFRVFGGICGSPEGIGAAGEAAN